MPAAITTSATSAFSASTRAARSGTKSPSAERRAPTHRSGTVIGPSVAKAEVPETLARLLEVYVEQRHPDERFLDTVRRLGVKPFKERVYAAPAAA